MFRIHPNVQKHQMRMWYEWNGALYLLWDRSNPHKKGDTGCPPLFISENMLQALKTYPYVYLRKVRHQ